jgi:hypothetical protein
MAVGKQKLAVVKKPQASGASKKAAGKGTATLRKAASKKVNEHSEELAQSLLDGALKGQVMIARMLLELADSQFGEDGDEGSMQSLRSWAGQLSSEDPWHGENSEEGAEVGAARREPEG